MDRGGDEGGHVWGWPAHWSIDADRDGIRGIDDDLPRPRRLPDGATEEARIELERGVKRRLEGVREAIVVPPRDRRDVAHGHRRTTRGRRLSRRADRLARHGAVHDLHEAARTRSASAEGSLAAEFGP